MQYYIGGRLEEKFFGASTEIKPIAQVMEGAKYYEIDTGKVFIFDNLCKNYL
jgi:hypothetical protein